MHMPSRVKPVNAIPALEQFVSGSPCTLVKADEAAYPIELAAQRIRRVFFMVTVVITSEFLFAKRENE
jgi:hypothetical protein